MYRFKSELKPSGGYRKFSVPKPELKKFQKKLHKLLKTVTYPATTHYGISRRSNITNASIHRGQKVVLNFDIKSFFPSIHPEKVRMAFIEEQDCSPAVASIITRLVTVNHQLPQGAPTSTDISNIVTFRLQRRLKFLAQQWGFRFTCYADDFSFSCERDIGEKIINDFKKLIYKIIKDEGFALQKRKEVIATKSDRQSITGVDIGHGFGINRKKRRLWAAEIFNTRRDYSNGQIDELTLKRAESRYSGRIGYVESVKTFSQRTFIKN